MKKPLILLQILLLTTLSLTVGQVSAKETKKVTHVVMVWLKEAGNVKQRNAFIKASEKLNDLEGIVHRHIGVVLPSERKMIDDTFDVAITVTLKSQAALTAYLNNPKHKKILHNEIKPLVNRVVAYDFISQ